VQNVVVVRNSETLPSDGVGSRLWRSGMIAKALFDSRKYRVDWVVSSFDHYNKQQRIVNKENHEGSFPDSILSTLKSPGYKKNISIARLYDHFIFSIKLGGYLVKTRKKIDVIHCSFPTIESSFVCVLFGVIFKKPVAIDIRDKWPDLLLEKVNPKKAKLFSLLMTPYYLLRYFTFKKSTVVIGANSDFCDWARNICGRVDKENFITIPIGFSEPDISEGIQKSVVQEYSRKYAEDVLILGFGGTLGSLFDFLTIQEALLKMDEQGIKYEFRVFGDGDKFSEIKQMFENNNSVKFYGRVTPDFLFASLLQCKVLIAPYIDSKNFENHIPNKISEYLAAGKYILTSLNGVAGKVLEEHGVGAIYKGATELAGHIERLSKNEVIVAEKAKSLFNNHFAANKVNNKHLEVIGNLVSE
jgi:glycosyltransferase involved in cell wall biosynthesis